MITIDFIVNRGTINITSPTNLKTGTTVLKTAGPQKILFADFGFDDYDDANYNLVLNVFDASGVPVGFVRGAQELDGFNVTLSFDAYITFNANS